MKIRPVTMTLYCCKRIHTRTHHISWPIWVKFDTGALHTYIAAVSNCDFRKSRWSESYALLYGQNEMLPHFLCYSVNLDEVRYRWCLQKFTEFYEFRKNWHSESYTVLRGINWFVYVLLHLFFDLGQIRHKNLPITLLNNSYFHENRRRVGPTFLMTVNEIICKRLQWNCATIWK